jgi:hypothetical protein
VHICTAAAAAAKATAEAAAAGALVAREVFSPDSPPTSGGELGSLGRWPTEDKSSAQDDGADSHALNGDDNGGAVTGSSNGQADNNNNTKSSSNSSITISDGLPQPKASEVGAPAEETDAEWLQRAEVCS